MVTSLTRPVLLLGAVGCTALAARLALLFVAPTPVPDTDGYFGVAALWLHGPESPDAVPVGTFRTPGYALVVLPFEPLPGDWHHAVVIAQHGLGVAIAVAVAALAVRWFGLAAGAIAGVVAATAPLMVATERLLTPDVAFAAAVLAATAVLVEAVRRESPAHRMLALAGLGYGLAAYLKPVAQCFLLAGLVPLAVTTRNLRATAVGSGVLALAMAATLLPWIARNALVYERPVMSSITGLNLYLRVFDVNGRPLPDTEEGRRLAAVERALRARADDGEPLAFRVGNDLARRGMDPDEARELQGRVALTAILDAPLAHLRSTVAGIADFADYVHELSDADARPIADELPRSEAWGARGLALRIWQAGSAAGSLWWLLSLHGLLALALLVWGRREERATIAALGWAWLLLASATSVSSPVFDGFPRLPAQGAPLLWIGCSGALAAAAAALPAALRDRRPDRPGA